MVSLGGVQVVSNPNIASIAPEKRNCYFDYENPPDRPLTAHLKYSQVRLKWLGWVNYRNLQSFILKVTMLLLGIQKLSH